MKAGNTTISVPSMAFPWAAFTVHVASDLAKKLPIFPHYSFELDALYGAVDGQKFGSPGQERMETGFRPKGRQRLNCCATRCPAKSDFETVSFR
ncbi:MAG TPA: hypothetical protein VE860_05580 [Chthoniobacterales bacterium]|jgi:hypothetical protein|nr:hypothetical protein [Chthoniobacterales bacterium]